MVTKGQPIFVPMQKQLMANMEDLEEKIEEVLKEKKEVSEGQILQFAMERIRLQINYDMISKGKRSRFNHDAIKKLNPSYN